MNRYALFGYTVLLLPSLLALLVRPSERSEADPRKVRRLRFAAVGFPFSVALIYGFYFAFLGGQPEAVAPTALLYLPLFLWGLMSWYFFLVLLWQLRAPHRPAFPDDRRRAASLEPRHASKVIADAWWWGLGALVAATGAGLLIYAPEAQVSLVFLVPAAVLTALAPRMLRHTLTDAEPLPPSGPRRDLQQAYGQRRRYRSLAIFALAVWFVLKSVFFAAAYGWNADLGALAGSLFRMSAITALAAAVYAWMELRLHRRIHRLRLRIYPGEGADPAGQRGPRGGR